MVKEDKRIIKYEFNIKERIDDMQKRYSNQNHKIKNNDRSSKHTAPSFAKG